MALVNLTSSKILIVEEQPLALNYIKHSLERLDYQNVRFAESAPIAKEICQVETFDLIICSFDLSKKQDGYQLYEELKAKRLVRNITGFIFVSAETSGALVHSVLELQPDDFLVKPFTINELKARIERVLKRKRALKKVLTLIDDGNDSKALKFINSELDKNDQAHTPLLLRLKGDALIRLKQYEEAKQFFKSALELQKFTWAKIGLIEALIANNEHVLAHRMLKTLLEKSETRLVALDLLGQLEIRLNQFEQAQEFLSQASEIAPRNISRQKSLSRVAQINHDYERSYIAHKDIATYAKNSIHDSPEVYLNVVRAGIDFALSTDQSEQITRITRQTQQYLQDLKHQFPHADNQAQIDVLNARLHYLRDENQKAKRLMEQLEDEKFIRSIDGALDKAKALHELGFHHKAQALFNQIIDHCEKHNKDDDDVMLHYIHQQQSERKDITMGPRELNNHAVNQFNRGQIEVALEAFSQAFRIMPKNASIALNLLQCLLDSSSRKGQTFNSNLAGRCVKTLKEAKLEPEQESRFELIMEKLKEMGLSLN
ncbi:response regulator [Pseudoalteromonas xiamenensis]|uniref:response regulator n=1 Tax=Pseudoalteromonas xiamenensis TaxID=882626 RepID=UPI0027E3D5EA|nr:response regulator [Pseudoalteromonas xiamenensis]WMN59470.1 response regulator [Pseudoalteromonas xiamenensis]